MSETYHIVLTGLESKTRETLISALQIIDGASEYATQARNDINHTLKIGFETKDEAEATLGYILGSLNVSYIRPRGKTAPLTDRGKFTLQNKVLKGVFEGMKIDAYDAQEIAADLLAACDRAGITPLQKAKEGVTRGHPRSDPRTPPSTNWSDQ